MRNLNTTELVQISGGDANAAAPSHTQEEIRRINDFLAGIARLNLGVEAGNIDIQDLGPPETEGTLWVNVGGELLDTSAEILAQLDAGLRVSGAEAAGHAEAETFLGQFSPVVEGNLGGVGEAFVGSTFSAALTEIALSDVNNTALAVTIFDSALAINTTQNNGDLTALFDSTQINAQNPDEGDLAALDATKLAFDSVIDIYNQVLPSFEVGQQSSVLGAVSEQPEHWATVFSGSMLNGAVTVVEAIANGEANPDAMQTYFDGIQTLLVDNGYLTEVESGTANNFGTGIFNAGAEITAANAISTNLVT